MLLHHVELLTKATREKVSTDETDMLGHTLAPQAFPPQPGCKWNPQNSTRVANPKSICLKTSQSWTRPSTSEKRVEVPDQAVLRIEAQPTRYKLSLSSDSVNEGFSFPTSDLIVFPLVSSVFCGAMFGVYSFGKGEPVLQPADFSEISSRMKKIDVSICL